MQKGKAMRVAIIEDDEATRCQLVNYLQRYSRQYETEFQIQQFSDGIQLAENYRPVYDILLMDIRMQGMSGLDAAECILKEDQAAKILFLTSGWANVYRMRLSRIATSAARRATAIPTVKMMAATCCLFSVQYARKNTKVVVVRFAAKKARYRQKNSDAVGQDVKMAIRSLISLVDV